MVTIRVMSPAVPSTTRESSCGIGPGPSAEPTGRSLDSTKVEYFQGYLAIGPGGRRCRSCHNVRSSIQRLSKHQGTLVKDFREVGSPHVEEYYKSFGHLRSERLRLKMEEAVTR